MRSVSLTKGIRTALGVFIHDAEITALFHHEPFLRHRGKYIPLACSSEAFFAKSVDCWLRLMKRDANAEVTAPLCSHNGATPLPSLRCHISSASCFHTLFSAYAILEGIGAAICEDRIGDRFDHMSAKTYELDLVSWYETYGQSLKSESDPLCLSILWHWIFMSNLVDLSRLELAVGKKGASRAASLAAYIHEWSSSIDSKRCLIHASLLQSQLENIPLRRVLAIHVPRCLFSAAITWAAHLHSGSLTIPPLENLDFPELRLLGVNFSRHWNNVIGARKGSLSTVKGNTLCKVADMLREISHWEIAGRFSRILAPLIHEGVDEALLLD